MSRMRHPVAYVRRSTADAGNPGDVSREVQEAAVRTLAQRDGHNGDVRYYVDWARSADEEKEHRRTEFRAMLAAVESGSVSVIYAYSLDRLARSTVTFAKLLKAAKDNGVRVVTEREGDLSDNGNPTSWAFGFLVSFFAEFELRMAKARAAGVMARRRARGDVLGPPHFGGKPGEDLPAVIAAFEERGSANGAAWKLNEDGVRPRRGTSWSASTVRKILIHEGLVPELGTGRGVKPRSTYMLSRILRCRCGRFLTGTHAKSNAGRTLYRCIMAQNDPNHGRKSVVESALLPWVRAEAARLHGLPEAVRIAEDAEAERAAVSSERERIAFAYGRGGMSADAYVAEDDRLAAELARIDAEAAAVEVPALDWTWPPDEINAVLRLLWERIDLDDDMAPIEAVWRVPSLRAG